MTLTSRKLSRQEFRVERPPTEEGLDRLLEDVMKCKVDYIGGLSKLIRRWVVPLGIALVIWMIAGAIIWLSYGAPIWKP